MRKVLFICNQNKNRSVTAEKVFREKYDTRSAGLYNEKPVTEEELEWADLVVVMEDGQRSEIGKRFPKQYMKKQIVSLDIEDVYKCDDPKLVELLLVFSKGFK